MKLSRDYIAGMLLLFFFILFTELPDLTSGNPRLNQDNNSSHKDSLDILDSLMENNRAGSRSFSVHYAKRAIAIANRSESATDLVKAWMIVASSFTKDDQDSSFFYYNKAMKLATTANLINQKAAICFRLSSIYRATYDLKTGIYYLDSTIRFAETAKEFTIMADAYNEYGNLKYNVQDTADAIRMYRTSFQIAKEHSLYKQMGIVMGNLATKFETNIKRSIKLQQEAIGYLKKVKWSEEAIATILVNIGNRYKKPDSALFYFEKALEIARSQTNPELAMGVYNSMAYSYKDMGNIAKAEDCLVNHAIPLALQQKNDDWLYSLYDSYADILMSKGSYKEAVIWEKKAVESRIKSDKRQAASQIRLLAATLDVKNKELIIQNKGKELVIQSNRLQQTRLWLTITVLLVIGSVFVTLWLQSRYRMRFQIQQIASAKRLIEMEESEKGRIARELHDITGQLILGIMGTINNIDLPEEAGKHEIKQKIKELGQSIRLISHRMNKAMLEQFTFEELVLGQSEDIRNLTGMEVDLEMTGDYTLLPEEMVLHMYRIIQELLTNASKYAKEKGVILRIVSTNRQVVISYMDHGPGFDPEAAKDGMGILNIYERAKLLGGKARVESAPGHSTHWEITIPR